MPKFINTEELNFMLNYGLDVYIHFLGEVKIGKKILSPIRVERIPSFSIYVNEKSGNYWWKDQGSDLFGEHWDFISRKQGWALLSLSTMLNRIS
jgi:hypothetical protein